MEGRQAAECWLGVQAMRAAACVDDGRLPTSLLYERIHRRLAPRTTRDLMYRINVAGMSRQEIGQLAPLVIEAGGQGDAMALKLIRQGA